MGQNLNPPKEGVNPRGFYEDMNFVNVHEALLKRINCNWANPPTYQGMTTAVAQGAQLEIRFLVMMKLEIYGRLGIEHWGFKDQRACLLLPLYTSILRGLGCRFIVMHRNPLATARSFLRVWPDLFNSLASALYLIAKYELGIAEFLGGQSEQAIHISFEQFFEDSEAVTEGLEQALGLELTREHLDPTLRHF